MVALWAYLDYTNKNKTNDSKYDKNEYAETTLREGIWVYLILRIRIKTLYLIWGVSVVYVDIILR